MIDDNLLQAGISITISSERLRWRESDSDHSEFRIVSAADTSQLIQLSELTDFFEMMIQIFTRTILAIPKYSEFWISMVFLLGLKELNRINGFPN